MNLKSWNGSTGSGNSHPKKKYVDGCKEFPIRQSEINHIPPFLWIALKDRIKIVREKANASKRLKLKRIKHTNLSGGRYAYSGGELWFVSNDTIIINGCSGRYGPRTKDQFDNMVGIFKATGWNVIPAGWDSEVNRPVKFLRSLWTSWKSLSLISNPAILKL